MSRLSRMRRIAIRSGLGIALASIVISLPTGYHLWWQSEQQTFTASIGNGGIGSTWRTAKTPLPSNPPSGFELRQFAPEISFRAWCTRAGWPEFIDDPTFGLGLGIVHFPVWPLAIAIAILYAWLFYRDRRRIEPGHCRACGYDLAGNTLGRCPECGAAVNPTPSAESTS